MWQVGSVVALQAVALVFVSLAWLFRYAEGAAVAVRLVGIVMGVLFNLLSANLLIQYNLGIDAPETSIAAFSYISWVVMAAIAIFAIWQGIKLLIALGDKNAYKVV